MANRYFDEQELESTLARLWKSDVPEGRCGDWVVERYRVHRGPPPLHRLAGLRGYPDYLPPSAGTYTRLRCKAVDFMTDTPDEWFSHRQPVLEAARRGGTVLISGLGLGLAAQVMLLNPYRPVDRVTVLEQSPEVIQLVGGHLQARFGGRLEIVQADAFHWPVPKRLHFDVAWHDIWDRPDPAYLPAMDRLEERYRGCCDWQGCWGRDYIQDHLRGKQPPERS